MDIPLSIEKKHEFLCAVFWMLFALGCALVLATAVGLWKLSGDIKTLVKTVQIAVGFSFFPTLTNHRQFEWEGCWFDHTSKIYTTRFRLFGSSHFLMMSKQSIHYLNWSKFIIVHQQQQHQHAKKVHFRPVRSLLVKKSSEEHLYQHFRDIKPTKLLPMIWDSHAKWDLKHLVSHVTGLNDVDIEHIYVMHSFRNEKSFSSLEKLNVTQVF